MTKRLKANLNLQNPRVPDDPSESPPPSASLALASTLLCLQFAESAVVQLSLAAMSQLSSASAALLRSCARQQLPSHVARTAVAGVQQQRSASNAGAKSSFESPFANSEHADATLKIPNFKKYMSKSSPSTNKVFSYFVAGSMGLGSAVGAKATVHGMS